MSVNKVMLLGNLSEPPSELKKVNGSNVINFIVLTRDKWLDHDGAEKERKEYTKVVVWGKLAEPCGEYLKEGSKVYVEGRLQTRSWDDKDSGVKRYRTEVNSKTVQFEGD